jgi:hypothetical protein
VRNILAFILIISFVGQTFDQGLYFLGYLLEKKEYLKRCENTDRPEMACEGKCQLMKKIKEQQEKERGEAPELKSANHNEPGFSQDNFTFSLFIPESTTAQLFLHTIGSPIDQPTALFHPPDQA